MFKKFVFAVVTLLATMSFAFADVDVNKGDQAALDGIKGLGPAKSKAILEERTKGGNFKDWADFEKRVKGIGEKSAVKLSEAGLTVNGQAKAGAVAAKASAKASVPAPAGVATPAAAGVATPAAAPVPAPAKAPAAAKASASK